MESDLEGTEEKRIAFKFLSDLNLFMIMMSSIGLFFLALILAETLPKS